MDLQTIVLVAGGTFGGFELLSNAVYTLGDYLQLRRARSREERYKIAESNFNAIRFFENNFTTRGNKVTAFHYKLEHLLPKYYLKHIMRTNCEHPLLQMTLPDYTS